MYAGHAIARYPNCLGDGSLRSTSPTTSRTGRGCPRWLPRAAAIQPVAGSGAAVIEGTPRPKACRGATDLDPIRLAYDRCARALEDLAYPAAQIVDIHRSTDRERTDALSIVRGVLSPTGLVDLALASATGAREQT